MTGRSGAPPTDARAAARGSPRGPCRVGPAACGGTWPCGEGGGAPRLRSRSSGVGGREWGGWTGAGRVDGSGAPVGGPAACFLRQAARTWWPATCPTWPFQG